MEQLSLSTAATEPVLESPGATATEAHVPETLRSAIREAAARRSTGTGPKSSPRSLQLEKSPRSSKDSAQPQRRKEKKKGKNSEKTGRWMSPLVQAETMPEELLEPTSAEQWEEHCGSEDLLCCQQSA